MRPELAAFIADCNRKAEQARADGYVVWGGWVWEDNGPKGPAGKRVCKLEDYGKEKE